MLQKNEVNYCLNNIQRQQNNSDEFTIHNYYHYDSSEDYSYGFYNSSVAGHEESNTDRTRDDVWNVSFSVVNNKVVRETDGEIIIIVDESSYFSESGESHESTNTSQNVVANYYQSYNGTQTSHFERDAVKSNSGEKSYYEKITANWTRHSDANGDLSYLISADSDIEVAASGDYSSYLREYSNSEFNGSYSSSYYGGGCCGYSCGYSSSNSGSKHTYSENEHVIDVSESYESLLNESRHSDGGAFYRVSFDGSASGVGSSSDVSHSYNITETDSAWSYSCGNYVSGGSS
ncbi:MAG: hypothetical protein LBJ67_14290, partial [Planctomycetaceae bacterium]|nr:hypothetical protein [Planctomycetaceae bacterium]